MIPTNPAVSGIQPVGVAALTSSTFSAGVSGAVMNLENILKPTNPSNAQTIDISLPAPLR